MPPSPTSDSREEAAMMPPQGVGKRRRQASLYLAQVPHVEALRREFNPIQARLIPAHVTLCREDEVTDWSQWETRTRAMLPMALALGFGRPRREGNWVYLPVIAGQEAYDAMRHGLLAEGSHSPRPATPHLTIIHPRNGVCTDHDFAAITSQIQPFTQTFHAITLIEQRDDGPWTVWQHLGD